MSSAAPSSATKKPRLTAEQKKRVQELVEDEGWKRSEAIILVLCGGDR